MPKYNADEIFKPIEVVLDGDLIIIEKLTDDMISAAQDAVLNTGIKTTDEDGNALSEEEIGSQPIGDGLIVIDKQLAALTGKPMEFFKDRDFRKKNGICNFIWSCVNESGEGKAESKNAQPE